MKQLFRSKYKFLIVHDMSISMFTSMFMSTYIFMFMYMSMYMFRYMDMYYTCACNDTRRCSRTGRFMYINMYVYFLLLDRLLFRTVYNQHRPTPTVAGLRRTQVIVLCITNCYGLPMTDGLPACAWPTVWALFLANCYRTILVRLLQDCT